MCGKFTQYASWKEVHAFTQPLTMASDDALLVSTPMRFASIMHLDADGKRVMTPMRWGFADRHAGNPARPKHMHARCETIDTKPTFADAFRAARGILMVHTFNEGEELPNGKTQQWVITPKDGRPVAIAVVFEEWVNGDERLQTFIQVTTPANATIMPVTDRMPAILTEDVWPVWLGETDASLADVKSVLVTFEDRGNWMIERQAPTSRKKPAAGQASGDLF